jgi:putative addiction module component (TIGR02574 family)
VLLKNRKGCIMLKTEKLIDEALSLPVEQRAKLADELLKSLNPSQEEIDKLWAIETEKRVADIESGKVQPIPGEAVFKKIRNRLNK